MQTLSVLIISALLSTSATAQNKTPEPPSRVLQIIREAVSPSAVEAKRQQAIHRNAQLNKAKATTPSDFWVSVAGPQEVWSVSGFDSYRSWIRGGALLDVSAAARLKGGVASDVGIPLTITAVLREDLSYQPVSIVGKPCAYSVALVRTSPGHAADYVADRRMVKTAHEKAGTPEHYSVYQVTAGLPAGTFLLIIPYKDLGELDDVLKLHGVAYDQALGDEGRARARDLAQAGSIEIDTRLFVVDDRASYRAVK